MTTSTHRGVTVETTTLGHLAITVVDAETVNSVLNTAEAHGASLAQIVREALLQTAGLAVDLSEE